MEVRYTILEVRSLQFTGCRHAGGSGEMEVRYTILEVRSLQFTVYRLQLAVGMQEEVGRWKYDIRY